MSSERLNSDILLFINNNERYGKKLFFTHACKTLVCAPFEVRKIMALGCKIIALGCKMFYWSVRCLTQGLRDFNGALISITVFYTGQGPNSQVRSRFTRALETFEWSSRTKRKILILELVRHGVRTASRIRHACSIAKSLFSLISQSTAKYDRKLDVLKNAEFSKQENRISYIDC